MLYRYLSPTETIERTDFETEQFNIYKVFLLNDFAIAYDGKYLFEFFDDM